MGAWLDVLARGAGAPLWIDDTAYAGRLLAAGQVPWLDVTRLVDWRLRAFALLKPSLMALDLRPLVARFAADQSWGPATPAAAGDPLAQLSLALLAPPLRQHVGDVLRGLRRSVRAPLALVVPSPRAWPALASYDAFGERPLIGPDEADEASVDIAAFLRGFADCGVDVLLMVDDTASQPRDVSELDWYQTVVNVARHYGWDIGVRLPAAVIGKGQLDFVIAPSGARGVDVGETFFEADEPAPAVTTGGFRYASIPAGASPERVLARLSILARQ
jgi:hypothetical protein